MSSTLSTILVALWFFLVVFIGCLWLRRCLGCGTKNNLVESNRNGTNRTTSASPDTTEENVWSVSRQINTVYGPPPNYQWPTHDQHISMDSFSLTGHPTIGSPPSAATIDTGGTKITPPPYCEVELPSYEEAITAEYQNHNYETPSTGRTQIF